MREILFRGKREDNLEWVYGSLHIESGETDRNGNQRLYYRILGMRGECDYVDPETAGQYTGLTDKNGKKIFEGDILQHHNEYPYSEIKEIGVVFWDEKYCGWRRTSNGEFHHGVVDTYRLSPNCVYEIIGNVYDQKELPNDNEM
jgi:uncharacterized phage protein (TIGR01671 family)